MEARLKHLSPPPGDNLRIERTRLRERGVNLA